MKYRVWDWKKKVFIYEDSDKIKDMYFLSNRYYICMITDITDHDCNFLYEGDFILKNGKRHLLKGRYQLPLARYIGFDNRNILFPDRRVTPLGNVFENNSFIFKYKAIILNNRRNRKLKKCNSLLMIGTTISGTSIHHDD